MEWVDGNLGSRLTMKYPAIYLMEPGARGRPSPSPSPAKASTRTPGPRWSTAAPAHVQPDHLEEHQQERRPGKLPRAGESRERRPPLQEQRGLRRGLILDPESRSDTYPYIEIDQENVAIEHEASVSKIAEEQLLYLMSRGMRASPKPPR